ncbi:hypothetical protein EBZ37_08455 [bacterium]|nr:hypothetical protein [bacterium]
MSEIEMNPLNISALFTIERWLEAVIAGSVMSVSCLRLLFGWVFPIFSAEFLVSFLVSAAIFAILTEKYGSDPENKIQLNMLSRFLLADVFVLLLYGNLPKGQSSRFR